ncbi:MAG: hypothetical protein IVW56_04165 [Candidatus Binataceae bacterium]|nr:hypothetical protein [Candidatus Binataceae bacterium]
MCIFAIGGGIESSLAEPLAPGNGASVMPLPEPIPPPARSWAWSGRGSSAAMAIIASAQITQITVDAARRGGASHERPALSVSRGMVGLF